MIQFRRWEDLARGAASAASAETPEETLSQLLVFSVGDSPYAVAVERVREIVRIRPITPVPRVSDHVRGVIALRGEVVQIVDLRRRLGVEPIEPTRSSRIVVVRQEDGTVSGLLVDAVREVLRVAPDAIRPSAGGDTHAVEALCSQGDAFVSLISLEHVLEVGDAG